jgi:hypothetical protein
MNNKFFSLAEMKQPVNQWVCVAFLGLWCFWIVLFYTTNKAYDVGSNISNDNSIANALDY